MPQSSPEMTFVLAALATWRVTHLLAYEDGPWNLVARLRALAGNGFWGQLLDCFYCLSLWIAAAAAALLRPRWIYWPLVWLALSGAACILDRIGRDPVVVRRLEDRDVRGDLENGLLRSESRNGEEHTNPLRSGQHG